MQSAAVDFYKAEILARLLTRIGLSLFILYAVMYSCLGVVAYLSRGYVWCVFQDLKLEGSRRFQKFGRKRKTSNNNIFMREWIK